MVNAGSDKSSHQAPGYEPKATLTFVAFTYIDVRAGGNLIEESALNLCVLLLPAACIRLRLLIVVGARLVSYSQAESFNIFFPSERL